MQVLAIAEQLCGIIVADVEGDGAGLLVEGLVIALVCIDEPTQRRIRNS